ncbi:uncharacterized protein LOC119079856 isoform X2 [Bradysia coprophila]|uniref:uncharacterized protein LOC119079856 isoform X2 n=1 Tax=Bradysia coprophila TaxID=38358 RepID=UPI00187D9E15|nr:uncharacterized protein LOC119079856 isoform X2 [Bradysia coprophila]
MYQKFCQLFFSLFVFSQAYTLATQYTDLTVVIIAGAGLVIFVAVATGPIQLIRNHDNFMAIIQWCRALHKNGQHFHPTLRQFTANHLNVAGHKSMKIMKIFTYLLAFDGLATTILFTTLANLLPIGDLLLEKYHPPFPFDVPFHSAAIWESFLINLVVQTLGIVNGTLLGNAVMSIYCVIFIHLLAFLDVILTAVENFNDSLKRKFRKEFFEMDTIEEFDQILGEIGEDCEWDDEGIKEHIKIIVDMCSEFNDQLEKFSDLSSPIFLAWEFTSLFTTFICGIILLLERQHFILSLGVLMANIFFFAICLVNDLILDKISKINDGLYNLPWYFMKPSERRMVLMAKSTFNVQVGFTAGGIHDLNLEQFKSITEVAISNCLALKTLAEQ